MYVKIQKLTKKLKIKTVLKIEISYNIHIKTEKKIFYIDNIGN